MFTIVSAFIFGFLTLIWSRIGGINLALKAVFFAMSIWGFALYF